MHINVPRSQKVRDGNTILIYMPRGGETHRSKFMLQNCMRVIRHLFRAREAKVGRNRPPVANIRNGGTIHRAIV